MFTPMQDPLLNKISAQTSWAGGAVTDAQDAGEFAALVLEPEIAAPDPEMQLKAIAILLPASVIDRAGQVFDLVGQPAEQVLTLPEGEPDQPIAGPPTAVERPLPEGVENRDVTFDLMPLPTLGPHVDQPLDPASEGGPRDAVPPDGMPRDDAPPVADEGAERVPDVALSAVPVPAMAVADMRPPIPDSDVASLFVPPLAVLKASEAGKPGPSPSREAVPEGGGTFELPDMGLDPPDKPGAVALADLAGRPAPKVLEQIASSGDTDRFVADPVAVADIARPAKASLPVFRGEATAIGAALVPPSQWAARVGSERRPDREIAPLPELKPPPIPMQEADPLPVPSPLLAAPYPQPTKHHRYGSEIIAIKVTSPGGDQAVPADRAITRDFVPKPLKSAADVPIAADHVPVEPPPAPKVASETADAPLGPEKTIDPETSARDPAARDAVRQPEVPQGRQSTPLPDRAEPARLPSVSPVDASQAVAFSPWVGPTQILHPAQALSGGASRLGQPTPARQIAETVVSKADSMAPGRIEITLAPDTLGRVHFDMQSDKNGVSITLSAERPETLDLIRRSLPELAAELKQVGIEGGSFHFGAWNGKGQADGRHTPPQPGPADFDPVPARQGQQSVPRQISGSAQLDIRL